MKGASEPPQGELFPRALPDNAPQPTKAADQKERVIRLAGGAELVLIKGWIDEKKADACLRQLREQLPWEQPEIKVYGKRHRIPRLQSWHGDPDAVMMYSKTRFLPHAWHPQLQWIRRELEHQSDTQFNSVLANLYRDGNDGMGWHADDEPELGRDPVIASVSLGAARAFTLRPKKNFAPVLQELGQDLSQEVLQRDGQQEAGTDCAPGKIMLGHGDLLVMRGKTQKYWQHALPKTRKVTAARLNLTYRYVDAAKVHS